MKMNKPVRVTENGRHQGYLDLHRTFWGRMWFKTKWFFKRVGIGMAVMLVSMSLWVGGQMNAEGIDPIIQTVQADEKFSDYPLLVKICKAESGNRQFREDGRVLRGSVNPEDIGFCQINEPTHNDNARKLGYDIYTEQGNKDMAIFIFLHEGSTPWNSSRCSPTKKTNCWRP